MEKYIYHLKSALLLILILFTTQISSAQTTITTSYTGTLSSGTGTGPSASCFAIRNNNAFPVLLQESGHYVPANSNYSWSIWYKPTPLTGAPGAITVANGWTELSTPTVVNGGSSAGIMTTSTGINFVIPANTTYRFAVWLSHNLISYNGQGSTPNIFSAGGVDLLVGDNTIGTPFTVGWTGPASSPGFNPRFFLGKITFIPAQHCDTTAFPASIISFATRDTICANDTTTIYADTTLPLAQGLSYQLQSSINPPLTPWVNEGSVQNNPQLTATVGGSRWYRIRVLCDNTFRIATDSVFIHTIDSPPSPSTSPGVRCGPGSVALTATAPPGYTILWYSSLTSPIPVGGGSTFNTPMIGTTTTFYAQTTSIGGSFSCASPRIPALATVKPIPNPNINLFVSPDTLVCFNTPVTFNTTITNGGTSPTYRWYRNNTLIGGATTSSYSTSAVADGDVFYATLLSNIDCAPTTADTSNKIRMTVETPGAPSVAINRIPAGIVCKGDTIVYTANATRKGSLPTYQWKINGVNAGTPTTNNQLIKSDFNHNDYVSVTLVSNLPCASPTSVTSFTDTVKISVPVATVTPASIVSLCKPDSVTLTANAGPSFTYQWYKNGILIPGATHINYAATDSAEYSVRVTNQYGCDTISAPYATNIKSIPVAVVPTPPSTTFCDSGAVVITSGAGNLVGHSYQWFKNGTAIAGATNWNYQVNESGNYYVTITGPNGCSNTSNSVSLSTYHMNMPVISLNGSQLSTGTYAFYDWYWGATLVGNTQSITAANSGYYKVVVRDPNGCERESGYVYVIGLGIDQQNLANDIKIFPNPTEDVLYIESKQKISIQLKDILGRQVMDLKNNNRFSIKNLSDGLYLLQIFDEDNNLIRVEKVQKR